MTEGGRPVISSKYPNEGVSAGEFAPFRANSVIIIPFFHITQKKDNDSNRHSKGSTPDFKKEDR